jgi:hypothetical protein
VLVMGSSAIVSSRTNWPVRRSCCWMEVCMMSSCTVHMLWPVYRCWLSALIPSVHSALCGGVHGQYAGAGCLGAICSAIR